MLNKRLKVFLSLFTALVVTSTMSFATDATEAVTEEIVPEPKTTTAISEEAPQTEDQAVVTAEGSENAETTTGEVAGAENANIETKDGDVYQSGEDITLSDAINGNAFIMGNNVTVTGQIGGDLFVMARGTLNLDGAQIYGNVFAFANDITVNGLIYDLYAVCNNLNIPYNGTAYRDLKVVCQNANIDGVVGGNVKITASSSLKLENDCIIYKDLNYSSLSEIEIPEGTVQGNVNYSALTMPNTNSAKNYVVDFLFTLVFTLVVWALITFLAPNFKEKIEKVGKVRPVASSLFGLLGMIIIPVLSILLLLTVFGVPLAAALIALFALVISMTFTLTTIALANILAEKVSFFAKYKKVLAVVLVALVLWALTQIPYVGIAVFILIPIYGLGMFILSVLNKVEKKVKATK